MKNIEVSGKLKQGDRAKVYNTTLRGNTVLEGTATLVKKAFPEKYQELWYVQFEGDADGTTFLRWIRAEHKLGKTNDRGTAKRQTMRDLPRLHS